MRRTAAVMTLLLLLQWTLGGARVVCDMDAPAGAHAAMMGMSPRAHPGNGTTEKAANATSVTSDGSCDGGSGMTAAQCAVAAGCATSGALAPAVALDVTVAAAIAISPATLDVPTSWHARPELPPPRA